MSCSLNSFDCIRPLAVGDARFDYFDLSAAEKNGLAGLSRLPVSVKVLIENLLRHEDGKTVTRKTITQCVVSGQNGALPKPEIAYRPGRVLMQDFSGVPALMDLAAMRDRMMELGGDPGDINPSIPVDLVVDHSVVVDAHGKPDAFARNMALELGRNEERYRFLKWAQQTFDNFRLVPPGTGICHQVNLEYLSTCVTRQEQNGRVWVFPDTCIGTDSHTTMINCLGILGWGVGGIEAEATMLGHPITMLMPDVIGVRLTGSSGAGVTATDLVLNITQMLRQHGVVGKFVEFFGPGLDVLPLADRATISNMAPEYGATCGFFPTDDVTLSYLKSSGRSDDAIELVRAYTQAQGMWHGTKGATPAYSDILTLDLSQIGTTMSGPSRPEQKQELKEIVRNFDTALIRDYGKTKDADQRFPIIGEEFDLGHGDVVIAAITSCTNTSNPVALIGAGLMARNANRLGLRPKPWVKTSFAPGSQVAGVYMKTSGLQDELDRIGFNLVGFGCTTCVGNSGPLHGAISQAIAQKELIVSAVLSGNRNFEGRVSPDVQANYLASPMLVVAYALTGTIRRNLLTQAIGTAQDGTPVFLRDIWPSAAEIQTYADRYVRSEDYISCYTSVFSGGKMWQAIEAPTGKTYAWHPASTYIRKPPFVDAKGSETEQMADIEGARILAIFGDKITTDHISPAGVIGEDSAAGMYLCEQGVSISNFSSFGARRGNHNVMLRGTFASPRIRNLMLGAKGRAGGYTIHHPSQVEMPIHEAAARYQIEGLSCVVFAGVEYGTGSSRDWAAKGAALLGIKAIIAKSFERIHRSNLVGMGILPLELVPGADFDSLSLDGDELVSIHDINYIHPRRKLQVSVAKQSGEVAEFRAICRLDTEDELAMFRSGGVLRYVFERQNLQY